MFKNVSINSINLARCANIPKCSTHLSRATFFANKKYFSQCQTIYNNASNLPKHNDKLHKLISKSKLLSRLNKHPKFARYFDQITETGTTTTVVSFFVLHELSAIIPLFILWYFIYQLDITDGNFTNEYLQHLTEKCNKSMEKMVGDKYASFDKHRLIVSGTISYVIVKLLYPARILFSLWAAPTFGKLVLSAFKRTPK